MLINKCCKRKNKRKNPESAIKTFLPIDDFPKPELLIELFLGYKLFWVQI